MWLFAIPFILLRHVYVVSRLFFIPIPLPWQYHLLTALYIAHCSYINNQTTALDFMP